MHRILIVSLAGSYIALTGCSGTNATSVSSGTGGDSGQGGASAPGGATAATGGSQVAGAENTGGLPSTPSGGVTSLSSGQNSGGAKPTGGSLGAGGTSNTGGSQSGAGATSTGGSKPAAGGSNTGGSKPTGGTPSTAGATATGGTNPNGGSANTGGSRTPTSSTGGATTTGGRSNVSGGATATGGRSNVSGGATATGGTEAAGGQATGGTTVTVACTDTSTAKGTFTVRYDAAELPVTGKQKSYVAHTNWWHKYTSQSISYDGLSFKIGDPQGTSVPASDGSPTGFPSMFIGSYSGNASQGSNLPKLVSSITSVPTIFSTDSSAHDTSNFNATYDVWFTASSSPLPSTASDPGGDGALLMGWLFKPSDRQPRGGTCTTVGCQPNVANHTVAGVSQATWDVWLGAGSGTRAPCVSYVSTTPLDSLSFDLNKFILDAVANSYYVKSTMNLSIVFAGFEIWAGGDGLQAQQYCAQVN